MHGQTTPGLEGEAVLSHAPTTARALAEAEIFGADGRLARALACVMGDMDLVRPLGLAGVPCAVADPFEPAFFSRFTTATVEWPASLPAEERIARLIAFARAQAEPPVVLPQNDGDLLLISRNRARFGDCARLALGDAELIEDRARTASGHVPCRRIRHRGLPSRSE